MKKQSSGKYRIYNERLSKLIEYKNKIRKENEAKKVQEEIDFVNEILFDDNFICYFLLFKTAKIKTNIVRLIRVKRTVVEKP